MHEYPYLQWNVEVHQARLRAAYPHAADRIGAPVASGGQEYERLARLAGSQGGPLTEGGDYNINLITFQRTWLRPWAFFALDDQGLRDELLELFPDGAYVAFAGDVYCEARSENMDDHWRVLHALPGDGSSGRPALGRFADQRAGTIQHAFQFADGNVRVRNSTNLRGQRSAGF